MAPKRKPMVPKTSEVMSANASSSTENPAKRSRGNDYQSSNKSYQSSESNNVQDDEAADDEDFDDDMPTQKNKFVAEEYNDEDDFVRSSEDSFATQKQYQVTPLKQEWSRPAVTKETGIFNAEKSLIFQQMDADYYLGEQKPGYPGPESGTVPIIQLYGVTKEGHSVLCHVRGFVPYFYIEMPEHFNPETDCEWFRELLCDHLKSSSRGMSKGEKMEFVNQVSHFRSRSLMNYTFNEDRDFLTIYTGAPKFVKPLRTILERGLELPKLNKYHKFLTYESNILFVLRCMIDKKMVGANWVELPAQKYHVRDQKERTGHCQIEVDVNQEELISHLPDSSPEWSQIAPLRIMSFDIECAGKQGHFPNAEHDPVIQIANYVTLQGQTEPFVKNVFTLGTCLSIVGADVHEFETEESMLQAWRDFVISIDPDVLTGYNIVNFDLPYLLNRSKALNVKKFAFLGRICDRRSNMRNTTFSSKAYGTRESKDINIEGRVQLDVMFCVQRDHKLSSYTLNNVSAHFLGEQKEEVHHSIISSLQEGSDETRRRLAVYCLKDAYLPQRLLEKLMIMVNYIEMARVTGIPLSFILQRGQQIKVISQLLRKAKESGFLMPTMPSGEKKSSDSYEGGAVIKPKAGYYDEPIATLDFASLYPSIMIAHNLCYSTLIKKSDVHKLNPDQYIKTPSGDYFVKSDTYEGMLPRILKELLNARDKAKKDMKNCKDDFMYGVLNGRQLALKVSANSVYGFTGATVGHLPCLEVSASVTSFGREMIMVAADTVAQEYTIKNGKEFDCNVIYGDTDSIMVKFGTADLATAMELGKEAAALVSKKFISPIKLEFEKVYHPYLLLAKKRYAGLLWTNTAKYDKLDAKGIETVRRDNCALVKNVVSTCLHMILIERSIAKAQKYARDVISDLLMNKIDISMLVISKSLSKKSEAYGSKQAHVELAGRMAKRDPARAPRVGDRVPYVIIKAHRDAKAYEKSEDPLYVLENSTPIDTKYYLEKKLTNPLMQIFGPVMDDPSSLFNGEHTRKISVPTPAGSLGIMKFAKKTLTCLGCKTAISEGAVCSQCQSQEAQLYQNLLDKHNHYENIYSRVWTHCQRCQGSLHQEVLCTNNDCPIFYMRKQVQKDLHDTQELVTRFDATAITDW
ncbi:DNA polymerase delta catalytic subunit [Acrasis kona]|uniref:DNA polymerase n=1 Tax=Acrasis kona TaxID=1008807 RepID=A0AAW2Z3Q2_9EUKA